MPILEQAAAAARLYIVAAAAASVTGERSGFRVQGSGFSEDREWERGRGGEWESGESGRGEESSASAFAHLAFS
jgi:hypothetical protein